MNLVITKKSIAQRYASVEQGVKAFETLMKTKNESSDSDEITRSNLFRDAALVATDLYAISYDYSEEELNALLTKLHKLMITITHITR